MMEGEAGSWTVECLRGRLLAERVASKTAKEEAELLGKKLIELERQLRSEIESRNKAEKRLILLTEKMKSLNLSHVGDNSNWLNNIKGSSSSSTTSSDLNFQEGAQSPISHLADHSRKLEPAGLPCNSTIEEPSIKAKDRASPGQAAPHEEKECRGENYRTQEDCAGGRLALVPAKVSRKPVEMMHNHGIHDVLAALRHAREQLEKSMGRRDGIVSHPAGICFGVKRFL